jgi:hypothetical protein
MLGRIEGWQDENRGQLSYWEWKDDNLVGLNPRRLSQLTDSTHLIPQIEAKRGSRGQVLILVGNIGEVVYELS